MKNPSRRDLITGVAASATFAGPANAYRLVGNSGGTAGPLITGQSFVTGFTPGTPITPLTGYAYGYQFTVGASPITVVQVGRYVIAPSTSSHTISIYDLVQFPPPLVPGGQATLNLTGAPAGAFSYVNIGPIVLEATHTYVITSLENGSDQIYSNDTTVSTTSVGSGAVGRYFDTAGTLFGGGGPYGPLDFKYQSGVTSVQNLINNMYPLALNGAGFVPISPGPVSGTVSVSGYWPTGTPSGFGTITYQWCIDDQPLSGILTTTDPSLTLPFSWNTTGTTDGTHVLWVKFLDATTYPCSTLYSQGTPFLVHNSGFSSGAQDVWVGTWNNGVISGVPDRLHYDGTPNPTHNTYPVSYTFIAGSSNPTLRTVAAWWAEIQTGPRAQEYKQFPQWVTTPSGGVYASYLDEEIVASVQGSYLGTVFQNPFDGTRLNSLVIPYINFVEDPTTSAQWYGASLHGSVIKIDRSGNTTTVVGKTRKKSVLTLDPKFPGLTEGDMDAVIDVIGTFPADVDIGGANDLCFDPRDSNILYVVSQVDHFVAKVVLSTQTVTVYAGQPGSSGFANGAATSVALFDNPTSVIMAADGTMYIADSYNSAIRVVDPTGTTVSSLCGQGVGPTPPSQAALSGFAGSYSVTSITWNASTQQFTVVMSTPTNFQPGFILWMLGAVNSAGPNLNSNANFAHVYIIDTFTDSQHFTMKFSPNPANPVQAVGTLSGAITLLSQNMDIYDPPGTVSFASGYIPYGMAIRFTSHGNIVIASSSNVIRLCALNNSDGPAANTLTRIGCFNNHLQLAGPDGWIWLDVDSAATCGPLNDIVVFQVQDGISAAHWTWRMSLSFTSVPGLPDYSQEFFNDNGGVGLLSFGTNDTINSGPGHYPWAISFSRSEGRMISSGIANGPPTMYRIKQSGDPPIDLNTNLNYDQTALSNAYYINLFGTALGFPKEVRPAFYLQYGNTGATFIGNTGTSDTYEDLMHGSYASTTPGDAGDVSLAAFIQGGMNGHFPRPEIVGNDLYDFIYWIRRTSMQGSVTNPPVQRYTSLPSAPPLITAISATRVSSTSIRVNWTTSIPAIGFASCGSSTQALTYGYLPIVSAIETVFGTSHSVLIDNIPSSISPVYYTAFAKGQAGNARVKDSTWDVSHAPIGSIS